MLNGTPGPCGRVFFCVDLDKMAVGILLNST